MTPEDLRNKAHAEDLNVANGMIANYWGNSRVEDLEHFLGHPHPHGGPRTIVYYNEEYRPSFFAHLSLLNLVELITPFYIGSVGTAHHALYPDNASVLRRVHEQGGIGGYVHPFGLRHRDPDAAGAGSARELPVDAVLGLADFVDVACIWSDELGTAEVWYRLLNTGSRIPGTAGTDVMSDIWRHPAVGTTRTYVYTGEDHLHYDAWADAMAAGRAFVTSGPIMTLEVAGPAGGSGGEGAGERGEGGGVPKRMGEELAVSRGDVVTVRATARSLFTMHGLEIVQNGRIVHRVDATGDLKSIDAELEIPIEGSGWIAARALGPAQHGAMDSYLFAHTNPVFIIADGEPIRSGEDAAFFVRWIDQVLDELRAMDRWDDPAHKAEVLATFEEGRRLYQAQVDAMGGSGR